MVQRAFKQLRLTYDEGDELIERFFASQGQRNISQAIRQLIYMHVIEYGDADVVGVFAHKCNELYRGVAVDKDGVHITPAEAEAESVDDDADNEDAADVMYEVDVVDDAEAEDTQPVADKPAKSKSKPGVDLNKINDSLVSTHASGSKDDVDNFGMNL